MHVRIHTTDTIYISGTPSISLEDFKGIATEVVRLAQECVKKLIDARPITLQRAGCILEFAENLNPDNEFERMVMVILADTSNEIILTEKMKTLGIKGPPLDEGIPDKIKRLEKKGIPVYKETEIKNIRDLRNDIVHSGNIPDKKQAVDTLKLAKEIFEKA